MTGTSCRECSLFEQNSGMFYSILSGLADMFSVCPFCPLGAPNFPTGTRRPLGMCSPSFEGGFILLEPSCLSKSLPLSSSFSILDSSFSEACKSFFYFCKCAMTEFFYLFSTKFQRSHPFPCFLKLGRNYPVSMVSKPGVYLSSHPFSLFTIICQIPYN